MSNLFSQTTDVLGNKYSINGNTFTKTDNFTEKKTTYNNPNYGNITSFDISNPFQILIFYKDFNVCKILDDKLSEIKTINFNNFSINATIICSSNSNGIWIFDNIKETIILFDYVDSKIIQTKYFHTETVFNYIYQTDNNIVLISQNKIIILNNYCEIQQTKKISYEKHYIDKNKLLILDKNNTKYTIQNNKINIIKQ